MNESLEPMSAEEKRVLELATPFEPPPGAEDRVLQAIQASIGAAAVAQAAAGGASGAAPAAHASGVLGAKAVASLAGVMLVVGGAGGVVLGRTVLAPEPPPPQIIERVVRVEVPVPVQPEVAPPPGRELPPRKPPVVNRVEPKPDPAAADELLAEERELIETARSALLHGEAAAALGALQAHVQRFPAGRLDEERESLWVQALVMKGELPEAKVKAAQFHEKFPRSLLGPTVDAAIAEP